MLLLSQHICPPHILMSSKVPGRLSFCPAAHGKCAASMQAMHSVLGSQMLRLAQMGCQAMTSECSQHWASHGKVCSLNASHAHHAWFPDAPACTDGGPGNDEQVQPAVRLRAYIEATSLPQRPALCARHSKKLNQHVAYNA